MILPILLFLQSHSLGLLIDTTATAAAERYLPNAFFLSTPSLLAFHLTPFHRINLTGMEWSLKQRVFSG